MTLMVIVGIAFLLFCVVSVFIITALIQPPTKAVEYYLESRKGKSTGPETPASGPASGKAVKGYVPVAVDAQPSEGEPADSHSK